MRLFSIQSIARALLLVLAYLLAACGAGATGSAPPTPGPITSATPIAAPTQPSQPTAAVAAPTPSLPPTATIQVAAAALLISYHKSGGFAGIDEMLSVYTDGTIELLTRGNTLTAQADPSALQALQKLLDSPEFAALKVPVQPPAPDQFIYELTVPGHGKPITATDAADNPPVLRELIAALEQLKTQAK